MKYILILVIIFGGACSVPKRDLPLLPVEITDLSSCSDSLYFSNYQMIFLETNDSSLIKDISKIVICDDKIFISDITQNQIFAFNPEGQFLYSLFKQGRGPGECISLSDMARINDSLLILYADTPSKFMFYTPQGILTHEYHCPKLLFYGIAGCENQIACINGRSMDMENYLSLLTYDSTEIQTTKRIPLPQYDICNIFSAGSLILQSQSVLFTRRYDNTIYQLTKDGYTERYLPDFGKYNFPKEYLNQKMSEKAFSEEIVNQRNAIYSITNVKETPNQIFFNTNRVGTFIITPQDSTCIFWHYIINHDLHIKHYSMIPVEDPDNKYIGFSENIMNLKNHIKYNRKLQFPQWFKDKMETIPDDNNPVLFLYTVRNKQNG